MSIESLNVQRTLITPMRYGKSALMMHGFFWHFALSGQTIRNMAVHLSPTSRLQWTEVATAYNICLLYFLMRSEGNLSTSQTMPLREIFILMSQKLPSSFSEKAMIRLLKNYLTSEYPESCVNDQ